MKKLLILAILFCVIRVGAVEIVDKPFVYFLSTIDTAYVSGTAFWGVTPTFVIPDLILSNADSGKTGLDVQAFNSLGMGLDYGRYVKSNDGKVYETFGASLFALVATNKAVLAGGSIHMFNRLIGIGGAVDCGNVPSRKRFVILLTSGIKLF